MISGKISFIPGIMLFASKQKYAKSRVSHIILAFPPFVKGNLKFSYTLLLVCYYSHGYPQVENVKNILE